MRTFIRADLALWFLYCHSSSLRMRRDRGNQMQRNRRHLGQPDHRNHQPRRRPTGKPGSIYSECAAVSDEPGCAVPTWIAIVYGTWSNPDPTDIQISSAIDNTNGTAVCKAATNGAVTLTGTFNQLVPAPVTKTVQLTCN